MSHRRIMYPTVRWALYVLPVLLGASTLDASELRVASAARSDHLPVRVGSSSPRLRPAQRLVPDVLAPVGQRLRSALGPCPGPLPCADTIRVAFVRIDFLADRGGSASTGDGRFDLSGPNPNDPPDPPPHNRAFFESHAEALRRYYDAQSYGNVAVIADVWPRDGDGAYSLSDMADFPFDVDPYPAAVRLFRGMAFAADSQSLVRGDRIPWDTYDRIAFIHAGSEHQSDLAGDSPEDIPSFTLGVTGDDVVIFPDSANRPITQAAILPETITQDGYYGALNGVYAHETAHNCFGLYDANDVRADSTVVGWWSLMDAGPGLGAVIVLPDQTQLFVTGLVPPSIDPFNRQFVSPSIVPAEIAVGDTIELNEVAGGSDRIRRVTLNADEYLLIENRYFDPSVIALEVDPVTRVVLGPVVPNPLAYDVLLPGGGVLIWHVDEFVIARDFALNWDPTRRGPKVIEADGLDDLGDPTSPYVFGSATDPWYVGNNTELGSATVPALVTHAGNDPHLIVSVLDRVQSQVRVGVAADLTTATLLSLFRADVSAGVMAVRWQFTDSDPGATVSIERSKAESGPWSAIATSLPIDRNENVFVDRDAEPGQDYFYRLRSSSPASGEQLYGPVSARIQASALEFSLVLTGAHPVGPSPVEITYSVATESHVRVSVLDVQGRRIFGLADEIATPGRHTITWHHAGAAAGLYFVVAEAGGHRASRKLVITP